MKRNAAGNIGVHQDFGDVSLGQNSQIGPSLFASKNGVDVSNRSAASSAVIGVVGDVEEASALGQLAILANLIVEVVDNGDIESRGTSLNPVLAQLITVTGMHRLKGVAQIVNVSSDVVKGPAFAALSNPAIHIMAEGAERD